MSKRERNIEVIREGMEAFNRGDHDGVLAALDPEIECHVDPSLMNGGFWHGVDGYEEMMRAWGEAWQTVEMTILGVETPDERHVIAELHMRTVGAGSGVPVEMRTFHFYEIRDDRALRFHIYPDRDAALAAIR